MEREASGVNHTTWRTQESIAGRWTSPDPYGGSMNTANPQSLNRYSYVQNDPVNRIDPSGLDDRPNIGTFSAGNIYSGPPDPLIYPTMNISNVIQQRPIMSQNPAQKDRFKGAKVAGGFQDRTELMRRWRELENCINGVHQRWANASAKADWRGQFEGATTHDNPGMAAAGIGASAIIAKGLFGIKIFSSTTGLGILASIGSELLVWNVRNNLHNDEVYSRLYNEFAPQLNACDRESRRKYGRLEPLTIRERQRLNNLGGSW